MAMASRRPVRAILCGRGPAPDCHQAYFRLLLIGARAVRVSGNTGYRWQYETVVLGANPCAVNHCGGNRPDTKTPSHPIGPAEFHWLMNRACWEGDEISVRIGPTVVRACMTPPSWERLRNSRVVTAIPKLPMPYGAFALSRLARPRLTQLRITIAFRARHPFYARLWDTCRSRLLVGPAASSSRVAGCCTGRRPHSCFVRDG